MEWFYWGLLGLLALGLVASLLVRVDSQPLFWLLLGGMGRTHV